MDYEVYCDESRPELFVSSTPADGKTVIGSLWLPSAYRPELKSRVAALREKHAVWGEFKWQKASPSKVDFYREALDFFFETPELQFRAIVIDAGQLDMARFHRSDPELGFYKFYYQLLHHWVAPGNRFSVFCDDKVNRDPGRLTALTRVLRNANPRADIARVQAVSSSQSSAIQLCDVLLGATQARVNQSNQGSGAKAALLSKVEQAIGHRIAPTAQGERKFNVFKIDLRGER